MLFEYRKYEFIGLPDFCEQASESACDDHRWSKLTCECFIYGMIYGFSQSVTS